MIDETMRATLRRTAILAGEAVMAVYGEADHGVETKSDDSPVTRADLEADAIICAALAKAYPTIPVVTEERAETHGAQDVHFLVDPLDGTKEFIQRRGDFTINIAYVAGGAPVAGVVFAPARRRLFLTDVGGGAALEEGVVDADRPGVERRLEAGAEADPKRLRVVASKSHLDDATQAYLRQVEPAEIVSAGSSLKFCLLAAGEADLYPRFGPTMEWDTAAGHAVLAAVGGRVIRAEDGRPLLYGKTNRRNPGFIASRTDAVPGF